MKSKYNIDKHTKWITDNSKTEWIIGNISVDHILMYI